MQFDKLKKYTVNSRATTKNITNKPRIEITGITKKTIPAPKEGKRTKNKQKTKRW